MPGADDWKWFIGFDSPMPRPRFAVSSTGEVDAPQYAAYELRNDPDENQPRVYRIYQIIYAAFASSYTSSTS
jgi:hypothetical protein